MKSAPKYTIITLGCKVNQYESEKLKRELSFFGFKEAAEDENPEICIVNTCTVTKEAARKSRQMARRGSKSSPETIIYAIGCAAEIPDVALANLPDNVIYVTNEGKENLALMIAEHFAMKAGIPGELPERARTRAYLKVQDGCDNFCSYCIIPYVRGRSRSREPEELLDELKNIETEGFKEVVITGIHLGDYGKRIKNKMSLSELVSYLLENTSIPRIRLSSLEPMDFSYDLLEVFKKHERLCRHLHLPIQHASDKILKQMNRRYTLEEYDKIVKTALESIPDLSITTDLMVGFPGEAEEDFEIMYNYIKKTPYLALHVFPYSAHERTVAAKMAGVVPKEKKLERLGKMLELGKLKTESFIEKYIGKDTEVLIEDISPSGNLSGHTGNYIEVEIPEEPGLCSEIVNVRITERHGNKLYGKNAQSLRDGR